VTKTSTEDDWVERKVSPKSGKPLAGPVWPPLVCGPSDTTKRFGSSFDHPLGSGPARVIHVKLCRTFIKKGSFPHDQRDYREH
jgi:hypothetical protein